MSCVFNQIANSFQYKSWCKSREIETNPENRLWFIQIFRKFGETFMQKVTKLSLNCPGMTLSSKVVPVGHTCSK